MTTSQRATSDGGYRGPSLAILNWTRQMPSRAVVHDRSRAAYPVLNDDRCWGCVVAGRLADPLRVTRIRRATGPGCDRFEFRGVRP